MNWLSEYILNPSLNFLDKVLISYSIFIIVSYFIISYYSTGFIFKHRKLSKNNNYDSFLSSSYAPSIAVIVPAYNESLSIVESIRSLLTLRYTNYEIIIVNDGSKDDTLEKTIKAYDFQKVDQPYIMTIKTEPVKGIYKSTNPAYSKLTLVDKEPGGYKSTGMNTGVNVTKCDYFLAGDADSILEDDTLLKLVRPILEEPKKRVIGVGGIVWLTNGADIENGKMKKVRADKRYVNRIQVIEYMRSLLLWRPGWVRINGLPLISGALGLFEVKVVKEVGGYYDKTVADDLELVTRLHRIMHDRKEDYLLSYVPEALCWTEGPSTYKDLQIQRVRWTRGLLESFQQNKSILFKPKYGVPGLLTYPYSLLSSWIGPILEVVGVTVFILMAIFSHVHLQFVLVWAGFGYAFSILYSTYTLFIQELVYAKYADRRDILSFFGTILVEPFYYHPRSLWWTILVNYEYFIKKTTGWTAISRTGFNK